MATKTLFRSCRIEFWHRVLVQNPGRTLLMVVYIFVGNGMDQEPVLSKEFSFNGG